MGAVAKARTPARPYAGMLPWSPHGAVSFFLDRYFFWTGPGKTFRYMYFGGITSQEYEHSVFGYGHILGGPQHIPIFLLLAELSAGVGRSSIIRRATMELGKC